MAFVSFDGWCIACGTGTVIDGVYHDFPAGRVTLRRADGKLVIDYPGVSVWFAEAKITHSRFDGGMRRLTINDWSTDYTAPEWSGDDVLTCEEEEDFDFGLMLVTIRQDQQRQQAMFS